MQDTLERPTTTVYQTRQWKLYSFAQDVRPELKAIGLQEPPLGMPEERYLVFTDDHYFNGTPSSLAIFSGERRTFFNVPEQRAAGIAEEDIAGCYGSMRVLSEDWNGHSKGALVHRIGLGITHKIVTYMVEDI